MHDQEKLVLELEETKAYLKATEEFLSEGIKALLLHTQSYHHHRKQSGVPTGSPSRLVILSVLSCVVW